MKKVAFIHTVHTVIPQMEELFYNIIKGARLFHLLDESILKRAIEQDCLTPDLYEKVLKLSQMAEEGGADVILVTCSSISPCIDTAKKIVRVPILRIDEPMAEQASKFGKKIAVISTLKTTLNPTTEIIKKKAKIHKKNAISIISLLCNNAFNALMSGDVKTHDEEVCKKLFIADKKADVIVLAQASMANVIQRTNIKLSRKVLTSPESGIRAIQKYL